MAEAEPRVTPPLGPTDAFSPWPTLISARMGVASDGSIWVTRKGAVTMVAPAGTITTPLLTELGAAPADALVAPEPEPEHHRGRRR